MSGRPGSHAPIRAERSTLDSHALPLGRNKTIWSREKPPNRETLSDRLALLTIPQRTTDHPEQTIERGEQDSKACPKEDDTRVDDEPFHHEAHGTSASVTTTRKPVLRAYTARAVERPRKRDTVTKTHFQSDLSNLVGWYVVITPCHTVSYEVNTILFQHAPNLFNLLLIHATDANAAVNLTVTVLNNFELKRDAVQPKNDFPAQ